LVLQYDVNVTGIDRGRRQQLARIANDVRLRCLREHLAPEAVADVIRAEVPELLPLEAARLARGWSRSEVSARLDALYEADGLAGPHLSSAELCRWEHGQRRPSDERIEYLCRLYQTRPDRLGFGVDYSAVDVGHLAKSGISNLWPRTGQETLDDLVHRVRAARQEISVFGLTRNFYAKDEILPLFESKAMEIPVTFYVMHPWCESRRDRYRMEPVEAAMEDPARYTREILRPLYLAARRIEKLALPGAGMRIFTYNFPCSFAIEKVDGACRVMLYGHGKRGTEGPIMVFTEGTPFWDYFASQIEWLGRLASEPREPWVSKGLKVRPLSEEDVSGKRPTAA
jgi:transcriptional regulator with XRE-family HTH domain